MPDKAYTDSPFGQENPDLQPAPLNDTTRRIFVAATGMNDGKTTTCLGLFNALRAITQKVGFIKPIGQRFVEVDGKKIDEDSVLFRSVFNTEVPIQAMSPVAIDATFTRRYLKDPEGIAPILIDQISRAFDRAAYLKDYIIIEGSGHAGVGAVFDLSNASVAKLLGAKVIIVAKGGIGRPVDEIALNKALFDQAGVEVIGAVLNKVQPDKMDLVIEHTGRGLARLGVPLLGAMPIQNVLTAPNLSQIAEEIDGRWLNGRSNGEKERILNVEIGAMTAKNVVDYLKPGNLLITPGDRDDIIFGVVAAAQIMGPRAVSGLLLTNNILPHPKLLELLHQTNIPVVISARESYATASKINRMTVKTQPQDHDKIPIIQDLIQQNVNVQRIMDAFSPADFPKKKEKVSAKK